MTVVVGAVVVGAVADAGEDDIVFPILSITEFIILCPIAEPAPNANPSFIVCSNVDWF